MVGDNVFQWRIVMCGPVSEEENEEPSPYQNGVFILNAVFPDDYPSSPPEIRFETPICHVNVNSHGKVCIY